MNTPASALAAFGFSGQELWVILIILLLLFGGAKIPSLARGFGQAVREFKRAAKDEEGEAKNPADSKDKEGKKSESPNTHGSN